MDKKTKQLLTDFRRMDLMLRTFSRIGSQERRWFIERLWADHHKLLEKEKLSKTGRAKGGM